MRSRTSDLGCRSRCYSNSRSYLLLGRHVGASLNEEWKVLAMQARASGSLVPRLSRAKQDGGKPGT